MKFAALELAGKGIRCNAVHPGRVNTPLISSSWLTKEDVIKDIEQYPLRRYGNPEEIAYAVNTTEEGFLSFFFFTKYFNSSIGEKQLI